MPGLHLRQTLLGYVSSQEFQAPYMWGRVEIYFDSGGPLKLRKSKHSVSIAGQVDEKPLQGVGGVVPECARRHGVSLQPAMSSL